MFWRLLGLAGVPLLVAANYYLRHTLEHANQYIFEFLPFFYPAGVKTVFSPAYPIWKLFFPLKEITGTWTTTSLVLTHVVEQRIGPASTWYLFNAILIVLSFAIAQAAFRSRVLSYTVAICMAFGTQLYHTYAVPGTVAACLILIYYQLAAFCAWRVIEGRHPRIWRTAFVIALVTAVISYEGWLDLLVFGWLACLLIAYLDWYWGKPLRRGLVFVLAVSTVTAVAYVFIKTRMGYAQVPGSESDVVFNYPALSPAIEDVIGNIIGNFHLVVTNFLPPPLVTSTAFFRLGGDQIVELQKGYHGSYSYLVAMNYLFWWRFLAGVYFALFAYAFVRVIGRLRREWSPQYATLAVLMLMMLTGGPTHALVKARPMHAMPLLGYHVMVGVIGASYFIGYLLLRLVETRGRLVAAATVAAVWLVVAYGALSRPAMLIHEAAQIGFGERLYPDPRETLLKMLKIEPKTPAGYEMFRLAKSDKSGNLPAPPTSPQQPGATSPVPGASSAVLPAGFDRRLPPLPGKALSFDKWRAYPGVTVVKTSDGFSVKGVAIAGGSGYQLESPPIPVPPRKKMLFRLGGKMESGRVCFGILTANQLRWLLDPDGTQPEYSLYTGENRAVRFVIADCSSPAKPVPPVFTIGEALTFAILDTQ